MRRGAFVPVEGPEVGVASVSYASCAFGLPTERVRGGGIFRLELVFICPRLALVHQNRSLVICQEYQTDVHRRFDSRVRGAEPGVWFVLQSFVTFPFPILYS